MCRDNIIRAGVAAIAAALIIAGVLNGGEMDVRLKAVMICLECIGIG